MPKLAKDRVPAYSLHKASGQAVVTIGGRDIYLGRHGTAQSREAYNRVVGEWQANGRTLPGPAADVAVLELIDRFWDHAQAYYRDADGRPTSELDNYRQALRPLKRLYGRTAARDFGPLALKALRAEMIKPRQVKDEKTGRVAQRPGWARVNVNKQISRVRHVFKWAVGEELVPAAVHQALLSVEGLRRGRSAARETAPVKPVHAAHVRAVRRHVSRQVWAMIRLQILTGARGGELFIMRPCDIDRRRRRRSVWVYAPQHHKTEHHGHAREIRLGRRARKILRRFLKGRDPAAYVFSPAEAEAERLAKLHALRLTPLSCGNRPGSNRAKRPKRKPGDRYDRCSYARAIARACVKANEWAKGGRVCGNEETLVAHWHPHQLRHNAATKVRRRHGLEGAQAMLGHKTIAVTQVYAERNAQLADRIAAEEG